MAAVGRTRINNGDKEKFHAANEVFLQTYKDVPSLSDVWGLITGDEGKDGRERERACPVR